MSEIIESSDTIYEHDNVTVEKLTLRGWKGTYYRVMDKDQIVQDTSESADQALWFAIGYAFAKGLYAI